MSTVHQNIIDRIQEYLKRLGTDEDFEKVRADSDRKDEVEKPDQQTFDADQFLDGLLLDEEQEAAQKNPLEEVNMEQEDVSQMEERRSRNASNFFRLINVFTPFCMMKSDVWFSSTILRIRFSPILK